MSGFANPNDDGDSDILTELRGFELSGCQSGADLNHRNAQYTPVVGILVFLGLERN